MIDSHQHVFWHGRDDRGLIADMDEHGILLAWLLTWDIAPEEDVPSVHRVLNPLHRRPDGTHAGIPLCDLVRARDHFPDRFVLGCCPHPLAGDAAGILRAAVSMHGVRVCGEWKFRMLLDDPRCLELFRAAGELGLPVVLHLDAPYLADGNGGRNYQPDWYGGTIENLERALLACPETIFIGHAPGFWREISGDAAEDPAFYPDGAVSPGGRLGPLLDRYANLYADLSARSALAALSRDPPYARDFLCRFARRLLFARDCYGGDLAAFLETLALPAVARAAIFRGNAARLVPPAS